MPEKTPAHSSVKGDKKGKIVFNYLDDLLIPAENEQQMIERVDLILCTLIEAGLAYKLKKCILGATSIEFLGFEIRNGTLHPVKAKVRAILEFAAPRNVHEV